MRSSYTTMSALLSAFLLISTLQVSRAAPAAEYKLESIIGDLDESSFGASVQLSGKTLAVAAPNYKENTGAVYIYEKSNKGWKKTQLISGERVSAFFGMAIALSHDAKTLITTAPYADYNGTKEAGLVHFFTRNSKNQFVKRQSLAAGKYYKEATSKFGIGLSLDPINEKMLAVATDGAGFVFLYSRDAKGQWSFHNRVAAGKASESEKTMGDAVAMRGNMLLASSSGDMEYYEGIVYQFDKAKGGKWPLTARINNGKWMNVHALFGATLAVDENKLIVGAPRDIVLDNTFDQGAVYYYTKNSKKEWVLKQRLVLPLGTKGSYPSFGWSAALSDDGNTLFVGATGVTIGADKGAGSVYIHTLKNGMWSLVQTLNPGTAAKPGLAYGASLAVEGKRLMVGTSCNDVFDCPFGNGRVFSYVYETK